MSLSQTIDSRFKTQESRHKTRVLVKSLGLDLDQFVLVGSELLVLSNGRRSQPQQPQPQQPQPQHPQPQQPKHQQPQPQQPQPQSNELSSNLKAIFNGYFDFHSLFYFLHFTSKKTHLKIVLPPPGLEVKVHFLISPPPVSVHPSLPHCIGSIEEGEKINIYKI